MKEFPSRSPVVLAAGVAAALALLFAAAAQMAPVVERGTLIDTLPGYEVERVRLIGVALYVDISAGDKDFLAGAFLILAAMPLGWAAFTLRTARSRTADAFVALAAGALYLAGDEALGAHETIGHNLPFLGRIPGIEHPDDAIILLYGVVAVFAAWHMRRLVLQAPIALRLTVLAGLSAAAAVGQDALALGFDGAEEYLEIASAAALLAAALALSVEHVRSVHRPGAPTSVLAPGPSARYSPSTNALSGRSVAAGAPGLVWPRSAAPGRTSPPAGGATVQSADALEVGSKPRVDTDGDRQRYSRPPVVVTGSDAARRDPRTSPARNEDARAAR